MAAGNGEGRLPVGWVALVLHAHLPYVRHPEHERSLEERWLFEALWECYLPIVAMLDRFAREGVRAPITISVSPPLAAMLRDDLLRSRFEDHIGRIAALAEREARRHGSDAPFGALARFYGARLREARATWDRIGGDVLGALVSHHREGRIELITTAASHAYLPGLLGAPASIRAQLRLGLRGLEALAGVRPLGLWLPECGYDPRLDDDLARAGAGYTVVDAHGLELAYPRPPLGVCAPVIAPSGVAFFARDPDASREVWSREAGYPGDAVYRDFYRDIGFERAEAELEGEVGPDGTRVMTGLKYHRITGPTAQKAPYDPAAAARRAEEHAEHFVARREATLRAARRSSPAPVSVAPYDAELFGHWWFEGPAFLEGVLRRLDAGARRGGAAATTLGGYLAAHPDQPLVQPAASSWGEGGFGAVWAGPATAKLWRHVHHAEQAVREAVRAHARAASEGRATPTAGRALDQAIRELLLLEASDWAFMIARGEVVEYAEARVRAHRHRAVRLAAIASAEKPSGEDAAWTAQTCLRDRFLAELSGPRIRDAFEPWPDG